MKSFFSKKKDYFRKFYSCSFFQLFLFCISSSFDGTSSKERELFKQGRDTLTVVVSANALGQNRGNVNDGELLGLAALVLGDGVGVGDHDLVNAGAFFELLEGVAGEDAVGGEEEHALGAAVLDAVLRGGDKGAVAVNHVVEENGRLVAHVAYKRDELFLLHEHLVLLVVAALDVAGSAEGVLGVHAAFEPAIVGIAGLRGGVGLVVLVRVVVVDNVTADNAGHVLAVGRNDTDLFFLAVLVDL